MTTSLIIGSVPAVLVGSFLSSRAPDRYIRPVITFVIFASGLKYVGVGTTALGWILGPVALAGGVRTGFTGRAPGRTGGRPAARRGSVAGHRGHAAFRPRERPRIRPRQGSSARPAREAAVPRG